MNVKKAGNKFLIFGFVVIASVYAWEYFDSPSDTKEKKEEVKVVVIGKQSYKDNGNPIYRKKELVPIKGGMRLVTNCRGIDEIGVLPPGKNTVTIKHRRSTLVKGNRCSQAIDKPIKLSGWKVKKEWVNELPLPMRPPGNAFVLRDKKTGKIVAWTNIKTGGISKLKRPKKYKGPLQIEHFANIVASITSIQIGYDGSSATFEFTW